MSQSVCWIPLLWVNLSFRVSPSQTWSITSTAAHLEGALLHVQSKKVSITCSMYYRLVLDLKNHKENYWCLHRHTSKQGNYKLSYLGTLIVFLLRWWIMLQPHYMYAIDSCLWSVFYYMATGPNASQSFLTISKGMMSPKLFLYDKLSLLVHQLFFNKKCRIVCHLTNCFQKTRKFSRNQESCGKWKTNSAHLLIC